METVLTALLGFTGAGFVAFLLAVVTGELVPKSRVERAEKEAATWQATAEGKSATIQSQADTIQDLRIGAQIANQVSAAVRDIVTQQQSQREGGTR